MFPSRNATPFIRPQILTHSLILGKILVNIFIFMIWKLLYFIINTGPLWKLVKHFNKDFWKFMSFIKLYSEVVYHQTRLIFLIYQKKTNIEKNHNLVIIINVQISIPSVCKFLIIFFFSPFVHNVLCKLMCCICRHLGTDWNKNKNFFKDHLMIM